MDIQQATSTDFVEVLFLVKQCVKDMNNRGMKQWNNAHPSPEQLRDDIQKGTLYLYKELGVAKGMLNLSEEIPEEYKDVSWKSNAGKILCVKRFAVHPLWQESDVSEKLVEYAEKYAKDNGFTSLRMDLLDSFAVDEKFFENKKFTLAGSFQTSFQKAPFACYEKSL